MMATILDFAFALKRRTGTLGVSREECAGETELRRAAGKGPGKRTGKQKRVTSGKAHAKNVNSASAEIIFFSGVRYERI